MKLLLSGSCFLVGFALITYSVDKSRDTGWKFLVGVPGALALGAGFAMFLSWIR